MKNIIKFIAILLLASFLVSCGSKKKQLEKTKSDIEIKRKLDSVTFSKITSEKNKVEVVAEKETQKEKVIEYQGKKGDSLKVIEKGADGKIISETIITGTGKATVTEKETTLNKIVNKAEAFIETIDKKANVKLEELHKERAKTLKLDVKKTGPSLSFYIWITAIIAIVAGGWWLNNKFSLIARLRNIIKKK
jgi:thiol:disulfide interchange protein